MNLTDVTMTKQKESDRVIRFLDLQAVTALHGDEIKEAVSRAVDSGWYLHGRENERFERDFADYIGTRHAVGVANGLDALYLILRAMIENGQLKPGDEIAVPANTYIATILSITENGLRPLLIEPDPLTMQMDAAELERRVTPATRAVMLVHLYGHCAYNEAIEQVCRKHDLILLEDNAQAHGCEYRGRKTGSLGYAAAHSFYPGKNLGALGDSGAVTTDNDSLMKTVRALANYGSYSKYIFKYCGRNSRLDEIQAAVLDTKLRYLDADNQRRRRIANIYLKNITNPDVILPDVGETPLSNVWHIFPIRTDHRNELQQHLADNGVETLIHYPVPPHRQECYAAWKDMSLPVTEKIHATELSLPISPAMSRDDALRVVEIINGWHPAGVRS